LHVKGHLDVNAREHRIHFREVHRAIERKKAFQGAYWSKPTIDSCEKLAHIRTTRRVHPNGVAVTLEGGEFQ
jgi:hypothetical protein